MTSICSILRFLLPRAVGSPLPQSEDSGVEFREGDDDAIEDVVDEEFDAVVGTEVLPSLWTTQRSAVGYLLR